MGSSAAAPPKRIQLTDAQWDELDQLRFTTSSADVFRNCLIILRSDSRDTIAAIAEELGCCTDTVKRIRRLYPLPHSDLLSADAQLYTE